MVSERIRPAAFVVALLIAGAPCHSQDRANLALTILSVPLIAAGQGLYWNSLLGGDGAESLTGISADREAGVWAGVGISWLGAEPLERTKGGTGRSCLQAVFRSFQRGNPGRRAGIRTRRRRRGGKDSRHEGRRLAGLFCR